MERDMLTTILGEAIRRNPLRSQREACTVAARRAVAALGPARTDKEIRDACTGLASGLFGPAYGFASDTEQDRMIAMMEEEYRKCLPSDCGEGSNDGR